MRDFACALLCLIVLFTGGACSSASNRSMQQSLGQSLYEQPMEDGNSFSCATCHALDEPESDGVRRVGHPIGGANERSSYKNGQLSDMLDAVNSCLDEWMNAPTWTADDPSWIALRDFLATAGSNGDDIDYTIAAPPSELSGGDADAGQALFNRTCATCHGQNAIGTNRGPGLAGATVDAQTIARRIRTSGNSSSNIYADLTGGIMPFWSAERLSNAELLDLVAYVEQRTEDDASIPDAGVPDDASMRMETGTRECPASHPSVGNMGELETFAHGVTGTATVINDCTIRVDNFSFDGGGIDVRWYAGTDRDYVSGFPISEDIFGTSFSNETVFLTIPEGKSLDDFDSISVWCVDVGANFGDTLLQ